MVIYGIALLGICTLLGLFVGELLGSLFGIEANVGGIGIAMFLLMCCTSFFKGRFETVSYTHLTLPTNREV